MKTLNIGKDFSEDPSGRYRSDGNGNGEEFREDYLKPALESLEEGEKLNIILDDEVEGYGSSFLSEGFAGLVKYGYMRSDELLSKFELTYSKDDFDFFADRIQKYISGAKFNSKTYVPTTPLK